MRLVALTFNVQTLEGDLNGGDGSAAVVIDIIGRPLTPLSCAGVARRSAPLSAVPLRRMNEGGLASLIFLLLDYQICVGFLLARAGKYRPGATG
jgi:hypothetical protein